MNLTTAELVERVREALRTYGTWRQQQPVRGRARAALSELEERLEERTRERDESDAELLDLHNRAEAAERERAEWEVRADERMKMMNEYQGDLEAALTRVRELEEALREIEDTEWGDVGTDVSGPSRIAHAALATASGKEEA